MAAGKLALMAGSGGREGVGQQTDGELVGAPDMWVGGPVIRRWAECV